MTMTIGLAILLGGVFAASATVGSALGFGFSAVGCLALILWGPEALPVLSALSLVSPIHYLAHSSGFKPRVWITTRGVRPAIFGGLATLPAGLWLLHNLPSQMLKIALAAFIGLTALFFLFAKHKEEMHSRFNDPRALFFVGMFAGLTAGFASFPLAGVIAWLRYHNAKKEEVMALTQPILIALQLASIALSLSCIECSASFYDDAIVVVFGLPATIIGSWVGQKIFKAMPQRAHGRMTGVALAGCAGILLVTATPASQGIESNLGDKTTAVVAMVAQEPIQSRQKFDHKRLWKDANPRLWNFENLKRVEPVQARTGSDATI